MNSFRLKMPLRAVLYKDSRHWFAHCLEFDLIGHGTTRRAALRRLAEAIDVQIETSLEHGNPSNLFTPADAKCFVMFAAGKEVVEGRLKIEFHPHTREHVEIEAMQVREFSASDTKLVLA